MFSSDEVGEISKKSDHEFEWTIKDFFSYTVKDVSYTSPCFDVSGFKWYLLIIPNREDTKNSGWIALYLFKKDVSACPIGAHYSFGMKKEVDGTTAVERRKDFSWVFEADHMGFGNHFMKKRSELLRQRSELAPSSDVLTITCILRVNKSIHSSERLDTLSEKLTDMLISKRGCDVTLNVGEEEFHAHRFVLSARSPVFATMFQVEMKEKHTGVVDIPDCHPEAFQVFLQYLYSGKAENISSNAFELYKIADKYDVDDLKSDCVTSIMGDLSVENVLDAANLADQLGEESGLNFKSQSFFSWNFGKIVVTQKWESFMGTNSRLANKLLKAMALERKL